MLRVSCKKNDDTRVLRRIVDVNYNRALEGLRTVEELFRFLFEEPKLTSRIKSLRHNLRLPLAKDGLLLNCITCRDSDDDIGKDPDIREDSREDVGDIVCANLSRVKE